MMTLRRAKERQHDRHRKQEVWRTFYAQRGTNSLVHGFGTLEILDEGRLAPGASVPRHPLHDAEVVTYVREGALAYRDSRGCSGVIHAGEFQRMTAGRGVRYSEMNASQIEWAHLFQLRLRPSQAGREPSHEQKRFSAAQRRGAFCVVAAPDARRGSLCIQQDAVMYSAILDPGHHVVHELSQGRMAWLHLVQGEITVGDVVLTSGDGVGLTSERALSLTAHTQTELLLLDLGETAADTPKSRVIDARRAERVHGDAANRVRGRCAEAGQMPATPRGRRRARSPTR
jgi:redox-sensitive bicupin YhaK (pirin superfamily)